MCWLHWVMRVARAHEGAWASFGSTPPVGGCRHFRGAVRSKRSGADPSGTRGGEDQPTSCRMKTHQQLPARKEPEPEPELDELDRRTDETSTLKLLSGSRWVPARSSSSWRLRFLASRSACRSQDVRAVRTDERRSGRVTWSCFRVRTWAKDACERTEKDCVARRFKLGDLPLVWLMCYRPLTRKVQMLRRRCEKAGPCLRAHLVRAACDGSDGLVDRPVPRVGEVGSDARPDGRAKDVAAVAEAVKRKRTEVSAWLPCTPCYGSSKVQVLTQRSTADR